MPHGPERATKENEDATWGGVPFWARSSGTRGHAGPDRVVTMDGWGNARPDALVFYGDYGETGWL